MKKRTFWYTLPLHGLTFKAEAYQPIALICKIEMFLIESGLSDDEAILVTRGGKAEEYGWTINNKIAEESDEIFSRLPKYEEGCIIDLTNTN